MTVKVKGLLFGLTMATVLAIAATTSAQVPPDIAEGLRKIGQIVDPACTAKLYRPLMPANDYNTYWPPGAAAPVSTASLYPGITIARDQSFGADPKDVVDIFTADKGGGNRPVLIFVPGGAGNKIEQQVREANAFYDNIGRWAAKNGMVGVLMQRRPGRGNWDDGGRDIATAVDWIKANVAKYRGNPNRMFIWAHSAGTGPLGVYIGHPQRWPNGVAVKGAIFMSGNPVPSIGGGGAGGRGAGPGGGGGRGGQALTPEQQAERDNLPGFKATNVKIMLARAELDPGVSGDMTAADKALHDEMCKVDGAKAKDGAGHCPTMFYVKGHSHMSEVFSPDTADRTVTDPILNWMKKVK